MQSPPKILAVGPTELDCTGLDVAKLASRPNPLLPPKRRPDMGKNRVVLITGAAGGMGALFAKRFLTRRQTHALRSSKDTP